MRMRLKDTMIAEAAVKVAGQSRSFSHLRNHFFNDLPELWQLIWGKKAQTKQLVTYDLILRRFLMMPPS